MDARDDPDYSSGSSGFFILASLFLTSLSSTLEVLIEASIGFILAKFKPFQILTRERIRFLSKLWFNLFIPCLFFIDLSTSFSWLVFQKIYMVFVFAILLEIIGVVIGTTFFWKRLWGNRLDDASRTVLTLTMVCHTSVSLPLVYLVALCKVSTSGSNPVFKMGYDEAHTSTVTALSVFIVPIEIVFYTIGFHSFRLGALSAEKKNPKEETNIDVENQGLNHIELEQTSGHTDDQVEIKEDIQQEHPVEDEHKLIDENEMEDVKQSKWLLFKSKAKIYWEKSKEMIINFLSPPLVAIFLAIALALIQPLKEFLIVDPPIFISSLKHICQVFSQAVSPTALIILGGNLAVTLFKDEAESDNATTAIPSTEGSNRNVSQLLFAMWKKIKNGLLVFIRLFRTRKIHPLAIFTSVFLKLVVFPLIGVGLVALSIKIGLLPTNDPLILLVVFVQFSMPMSMSLAGLSSLNQDYGQEQVCELLLWHYCLCPITLSIFSTWFLSLSCQFLDAEHASQMCYS